MIRCRGLCVCLAFLLGAVPARAAEAVVSCALFHKPSPAGDSAFVEVYWQVNPGSLHYRKNEQGLLTAEIHTSILFSQDGKLVRKDAYTLQTPPLPPGRAGSQLIKELHRYHLPAGTWQLSVQLSEPQFPAGDFHFQDTLQMSPGQAPYYSSLQLVDTFYPGPDTGPFLKNGLQLIPRMINFLDEGQRQLGYYLELYATDQLPAADFPLTQTVYISRKREEEALLRFQRTDTITHGASLASFLQDFSIASLPSGNYFLQVRLQDSRGKILSRQSTFFQCINQHPEKFLPIAAKDSGTKEVPETIRVFDLSKTFVARYDPAQLRAILKMILPIADPVEANAINGFLRKPEEVYTRYFIYNFFSKRDAKRPEQAWKEFSERVREVNKQFKSGSTMGYETDRGYIYLKFGKPDERVPVPNEAGALPYEVWRYNAMERSGQPGTFLFYQPGFVGGDYRLLHTTVTGELRNAAWRSMLYSTGHNSGNSNSRAEQYIGNQ